MKLHYIAEKHRFYWNASRERPVEAMSSSREKWPNVRGRILSYSRYGDF